MFRSYLKIGWRNLIRHKFYSAVSITGLAAGIAFTLLIAGYAWSELQVNKTLKNVTQLYLVESKWADPSRGTTSRTIAPFTRILKEQYPNLVTNYYRWDWVSAIVSVGDRHFRDSLQIGDTALVCMFGFPLLHGDMHSLFDNPDAVVITASKAIKYFGKTDVIGKSLTVENYSGSRKDFVVTGVLKDLPNNSVTTSIVPVNASINSTFIALSQENFFYTGINPKDDWTYSPLTSYIELKKGVQPKDLIAPIQKIIDEHTPEYSKNLQLELDPLSSYNLDANNGIIRKMVYTLSFVALFILLMAIVNFVNISIGNSSSRLKELGIRKVVGGLKKQLVIQLLTESVIIVFIAVISSLIIYQLLSPVFAHMLGKQVPSLTSFPLYFTSFPFLLVLVIGISAGLYPAVVLASLKSVESLKGKLKSVKENILLRRVLVGFQFGMAVIVFVAAIVVTRQVSYFLNGDLGFNKNQVINVALPRNWSFEGVQQMETLRNEMATTNGVSHASLCYSVPNRNSISYDDLYRQDMDSTQSISAFTFIADEKYASTFEIPLLAGKFFNADGGAFAAHNIVLNQAAVKALHWDSPEGAVGGKVRIAGYDTVFTVCGIVKDYHFESKHEGIKPLIFFHVEDFNAYRFISFKIKPNHLDQTIKAIQTRWTSLMPAAPFEYSFMDETVQKAYQNEIQLEKATYTATVLALIIVVLGIVGVVSLSIAKRTKEIGIRKVLGASVPGIIGMFLKEIIIVMIIANVVLCPIAYIIMKNWLNDYAYRTSIGLDPFILVAIVMAVITCLLVSVQTIKAAVSNPVEALRSE